MLKQKKYFSLKNSKKLKIEINLKNMNCFAVNPKCSKTMNRWKQMILKSNVTRWKKRYWNLTLKSTKITLKPITEKIKQSLKNNEINEFYYNELDKSKTFFFF